MLEGHAEGFVEIPKHVQGSIGILDVVVGQFLALDLGCKSKRERSRLESRIEVRALVRVLAVAETLLDVELEEKLLRKTGLLAHVSGDAGIVFSCVRICLCREFQARFRRGAPLLAKLVENGAVVVRVAHDGDVAPVLRRTAHHGRTADVDVLDGILQGDALLGDGLAERIEVHAHEFDRVDAVLLQGFHMGRDVAASQDAAVHFRMQCFHTAVTNLRESGDFADADGLHPLALQEFLRAPGGDDFPTEVHKAFDEVHKAGLIADTD